MVKMVEEKDVEEICPVKNPLDVLAQILISMLGIQSWNTDDLYQFIRTSYPYRTLRIEEFRSVLDMLAGRYRDSRIRELKPRITIDSVTNIAKARDGALQLIYMNGGTIPDRGYFKLRLQGSFATVGELDEEFVWERRVGDTFTFGTQNWRITAIDHQKVEVIPWRGPVKSSPFWKAEGVNKSFHFMNCLASALELWNDDLDGDTLVQSLSRSNGMEEKTAELLVDFLREQREATGTNLPHRHHLLIEHTFDPSTGRDLQQVFIHTLWGNRINYPFGLAIAALWERDHFPIEVISDNESILLYLPHDEIYDSETSEEFALQVTDLLSHIRGDTLEELIKAKLDNSGYFGARFRENAGRALLLTRSQIGKRVPLWLNRLKSKKLLVSVSSYRNFPILLETWRTCIQDEFDLPNLETLLEEIGTGEIKMSEVRTTAPSPFASGSLWRSTDKHMYADDTPIIGGPGAMDSSILHEAVFTPHIRPELKKQLVCEFQEKLKRTASGYAPRASSDLIDWVTERIFIADREWDLLISAVSRDTEDETASEIFRTSSARLLRVRLPGASLSGVVSVDSLKRLMRTLQISLDSIDLIPLYENQNVGSVVELVDVEQERSEDELESLVAQWISYYGPVKPAYVSSCLGLSEGILTDILEVLIENRQVVLDFLTEGATSPEICDAENLERILSYSRRSARISLEALPGEKLQLFLAETQRLTKPGGGSEDLKRAINLLFGFPARAALWEEAILPARLGGYQTAFLDELLMHTDLIWVGCGDRRLSFCFFDDVELFQETETQIRSEMQDIFSDNRGRYTFWDLHERAVLSSETLTQYLWEGVWNGGIRCDSYSAVRTGILQGFAAPEQQNPDARRKRRSLGFAQWKASRPLGGNWYLAKTEVPGDLIEEQEMIKDRVRILLRRYGVLFRDLLKHETPNLRWSTVFRTLRIMELAGEIVGGYFFSGITGIQFASHEAIRRLREPLAEDSVYWMNAADPASLCGMEIEGVKSALPERYHSTWMVFHGSKLVLVSKKRGSELQFLIEPENPHISRYLEVFSAQLARSFNPVKSLKVTLVNGAAPGDSRYRTVLEQNGFREEYKGYSLWAYS